jgi:hypothetical protein
MAGWQRLLEDHPLGRHSADPEFWEHYLDEHPDVLHRLLADVFQATHGVDRPPTLDDLWDLVSTPEFSVKPFGDALHDALSGRSVRSLAVQIGIHQTLLTRYMTGERDIVSVRDPIGSMRRLELIAKALRMHPAYFAEWRRLWLMSLLDAAFTAQPALSIGVWKRFSGFGSGRVGRLVNVRSQRGNPA